jgi:hypothetical protein
MREEYLTTEELNSVVESFGNEQISLYRFIYIFEERVMKNTIKLFGIIAFVAVIGFTVISCGGGNSPKSLAKQTYQVFEKAMKAAGEEPNELAFVLWAMTEPKELNAIVAKVEALSASAQDAYQAELEKLLAAK